MSLGGGVAGMELRNRNLRRRKYAVRGAPHPTPGADRQGGICPLPVDFKGSAGKVPTSRTGECHGRSAQCARSGDRYSNLWRSERVRMDSRSMVHVKRELQAMARKLRRDGKTYDEIAADLGVSRSSVSLWVRDPPKPPTPPERPERMRQARWEPHRRRQALLPEQTKAAAADKSAGWRIGSSSSRERPCAGPRARRANLMRCGRGGVHQQRSGCDPALPGEAHAARGGGAAHEVQGDDPRVRRCRGRGAVLGALFGVTTAGLGKTTLKKHSPKTVRKNVGDSYRGCLVVCVLGSADLYRRIEGCWYGIVLDGKRRQPDRPA